MEDSAALGEISSEVLDYIDELEDARDQAFAKAADLEARVAELEGDSPDSDPIAKALAGAQPELVQLFKAQAERLSAAEAEIASQKEETEVGQWVAKARSFDGLVDPEVFGPKLRKVADIDPELAAEVAETLSSASRQVAKSRMFDEIGRPATSAEGEALEQAEAIAKAAASGGVSEADRAEVWINHPDLYDQYVQERRESGK